MNSTKRPSKTRLQMSHATSHQSMNHPIGLTVGKSKYMVTKYLAQGSFGRLYVGVHQETNQEVAIKMEPIDCEKPLLHLEFGFYRKLHSLNKIVPKIYTFGPCGEWNALVMEMLGSNLEKMLELCGGRFSLRTTIQLTIQFIFLFRGIHSCGLLYRDTKPANFLLGTASSSKWWIVHVVDLGFCKEWRLEDGSHIPYQEHKPYTGTVRYMSINNHQGREQSRRDDLEAIGYMMVYFYKGRLPWQGVDADSLTKRYEKIYQIKYNTPFETLCSNMPPEYVQYFKTVRQLGFTDEPDYAALMNPFVQLLARDYGLELNDKVYDWNQSHNIKELRLRQDYYYPAAMQQAASFTVSTGHDAGLSSSGANFSSSSNNTFMPTSTQNINNQNNNPEQSAINYNANNYDHQHNIQQQLMNELYNLQQQQSTPRPSDGLISDPGATLSGPMMIMKANQQTQYSINQFRQTPTSGYSYKYRRTSKNNQ